MARLRDLAPDPNNARTHDERNLAAIAGSIERAGFGRSLLVAKDGTIIAGNATRDAAERVGLDDVLIIDSDGTKPIAIRRTDVDPDSPAFHDLALADNRAGELARWNADAIAALARAGKIDLSRFWTKDEWAAILAGRPKPERRADPDDAPEPPLKPMTQPGDRWRLDEHALVCGDGTQPAVLAAAADHATVDLIATDPPYGVAYVGKTADALTIQNDEANDAKVRALVARALKAAPLKAGGAFYVFSPAGRTELAFRLAIADAGLELRQALVWVKQHFVMGRQDYHWRHESILYGWKDGAAHTFTGGHGQDTVADDHEKLAAMSKRDLIAYAKDLERRLNETVLREDRPARSETHPTIKPAALVGRLIDNSSRPGEIVLDQFAGSGTTLIAAADRDRRACLVELDPAYCDVIVDRWQTYTGGKATRERA